MANSLFLPTPISQDIMASTSKKPKRTKAQKAQKRKAKYMKKYLKKAKKKPFKRYSSSRVINVANDKEFSSKSYKKLKVTKQQQKIINKRFKGGYSPFEDRVTNSFQFVSGTQFNQSKLIWRTGTGLDIIKKAFNHFPSDTSVAGSALEATGNQYIVAQEQSIYFNKFKLKYEIYNPCNFDINLVIYDIVYKCDTDDTVDNTYKNGISTAGITETSTSADTKDDPISLMQRGLDSVQGRAETTSNSDSYIVAKPINGGITNIQSKPTDFYPFNIYCKIIKKHTYRLQPGATMSHTFVYNPKALINRGYMGYKYKEYFGSSDSKNLGIKDFTCGCLFKTWGQIDNSGSTSTSAMTEVTTVPAKIAFKEEISVKWYCMNSKYNYIFEQDNSWAPEGEDRAKMEVVNDVNIKQMNSVNMDPST